MNTTENPTDSLPKDSEAASSVHPLGNPPSADTDLTSDPLLGRSFSAGLPPYFHIRPHTPDGDLKKGCTVKYSLKQHDLFNGDKIAKEWADKYGLEESGSGCCMVGDPFRDIQFKPLRLLPLELDPKRILPYLYTLEIDGCYVIVRFQTMRIPDGDIQAVFSFLTKWAESNNLVFASSCHNHPSPDTPIKDCYSYIMFRPEGDIGGKIELLVTPGHDDPNRTPFPTEDFVPDDSPFS